ncbi:MAG TPA: type II toxin-antitoxin system HicB family antitoxin [Pyrinomonadaceae bacterium]|nr:type II toxin-antitoxin system HicB family antitoxin [Pyrinomonadaceae bacterium]
MNKTTKKQVKNKKGSLPKAEQYLYTVGWAEEDNAFVARVAEFPSLAAHGATQEEALREIRDVVNFVLNDLKETGEPIPEPFGKRSFSGRLVLRMPEYMHRQLALEAMQQGISLNQLLNLKLEGSR